MFGIKTRIHKYIKNHICLIDGPELIRLYPVGYMCNHACPMCWRLQLNSQQQYKYTLAENNRLQPDEYFSILNNLPKSVKSIEIVGGGEPLLYAGIDNLIAYIKKKRLSGRLITNGSLMNNYICNTFVCNEWNSVRISLHAATADTFKKVTGAQDFHRVLTNIQNLIKIRGNRRYPQVSVLFVIQSDNAQEIFSFAQLAQKLKVDEIEYDSLIPLNNKINLTNVQKENVIAQLKKLKSQKSIRNNIEQVINMYSIHPRWNTNHKSDNYFKDKYCQIVQFNIDISSNGTIFPCCLAFEGIQNYNIRDKSLKEIWKLYKPFREKLKQGKFYPFCIKLCNYKLEKRQIYN